MPHPRRWLACLLMLTLLTPAGVVAGGQGVPRPSARRVAVLGGAGSTASRELLDGFRARMDQVGQHPDIVEVAIDSASGADARDHGAPADLVLAIGRRATLLAAESYRGTPTIGALLARSSVLPDGSPAAAVVWEFPVEVQLEWMRRILPRARRVGVIFSSEENLHLVDCARGVASALARQIASPSDIPAALAARSGSADVRWGLSDEVVLTRETADLAVRLLAGTAPRSIGAVRPRKVVYSVTARSADLMHIELAADVLGGASEVVR